MTMSICTGHSFLAAIIVTAMVSGSVKAADDPCSAFSWNVTHEHALFAMAPEPAVAGRSVSEAPLLALDRLYELQLSSQGAIAYALLPEKKAVVADDYGGLARLKIDKPGTYRVSLDRGAWVDVVANGMLIQAVDFQGRSGCQAPHKIVQYVLPVGQDLVLQLSGVREGRVRIAITRPEERPKG